MPFRDFYVPYGPANGFIGAVLRWFDFNSIVANRLTFVLLQAVLAGMVTYLVSRRRGLPAAAFVGVLAVAFSTVPTYTGVFLAYTPGILTVIGWRSTTNALPFAAPPSESTDLRLIVAGSFFTAGAWFQLEFGLVLVAWTLLVAARPREPETRNLRWIHAVPWLVACLPYMVIFALGGFDEFFGVVHYMATGLGRYRSLPADYGAPLRLLSDIAGNRPVEFGGVILTASFVSAAVGLLLLALGPLADRVARLRGLRVLERDEGRVTVLLGATAAMLWYSLQVRADVGHAQQLILPLWMALVWNRLRFRRVGIAVAVALTTIALVAGTAFTLQRWGDALEFLDSRPRPLLPGADLVAIPDTTRRDLGDLLDMWNAAGSPDTLFVANRINDITHVNAALVYWLLDVRPANWLTTFDPGFADQEGHQRRMARDLCEARAPVILMQTPRSSEHPPDRRFSPYLDRFLAMNYVLVNRNERFDYRVLETEDCVFPDEELSATRLEDRRLQLLQRGDELPSIVVAEWQASSSDLSDLERQDRFLLANSAGLWHATDEVSGLHRDLMVRFRDHATLGDRTRPLAIALPPDDSRVTATLHYLNGLLAAGDVAAGLDPPVEANAELLNAIRMDPTLAYAERLLRSLRRDAAYFEEATLQLFAIAPRDPRVLELRGFAVFDLKDYSGALELFLKAAALGPDPDTARLLSHVAAAYRALGDLDCAAAVYADSSSRGYGPSSSRLEQVEDSGGAVPACGDADALGILGS